ncbi:MAG: phosphoadenosine phosphosulfate reductase [Lysobacterales bacterium 14-68-21]|nr:MAG: phosphoadenosine phosphosulfate reductase [Xanthomonadales bacterium 15-68-25]OZB64769.1 MAG: phosphoadenosine phosphosulfate reductase [Xanthomonadales bacterium 14-68-21]
MNPSYLDDAAREPAILGRLDAWLGRLDAVERVRWALRNVPGPLVLSSSFGAQSALMLHMLTREQPDIPVVLIDTGYLFAETYRFVDQLVDRLELNLKVYRPVMSPAWMEARHGRLWEQGEEGIRRYNELRKVEPMQRALGELGASGWFSGLRRVQSRSRESIPFVQRRNGRWKFHPVADWRDRDVGQYLAQHGLPYHPLWDQGYVSIGDVHTTRPWAPGMDAEDTRFFGLHRECGLHEAV